jgi:RNA polymerase sigma-70 factor (ECF subfamily)
VSHAQGAPSVARLAALYEERYHRFLRVAESIVRDREAARDVVQEAFARLICHRSQFRGDGSVEGWAWRTVVNTAMTARRSEAGACVQLDDRGNGASTHDGHADASELRRILAGLPERQRLVLFLRHYADLDYRAIADALQIELGTVGATLNQAHRALRRLLEEVSQ